MQIRSEQQLGMDLVSRETQKLALLQADILLLPNSLSVKEIPNPATSVRATHRLEMDMKYALAEVKVLVTLAKPLDFTILTPSLLPIPTMLELVKIEDDTSLVDLVKKLVDALQKHHTSLLEGTLMEHVPGNITRLLEIYPSMRYELAVVDDNLTVILCFKPEEKISICSVTNLLKAEKLVNTADHCFNIKMEFDTASKFKPEKFGVLWSPDLAEMLPELADVRLPGMKSDDTVLEFVMTSKQELEEKLCNATTAWEERSSVLLNVVDVFADVEGVAVNLDSNTMTGMQESLFFKY